jgi:hypothetical protein
MNTTLLKTFATAARNLLIAQISTKLTLVLKEDTPELLAQASEIKKLKEAIVNLGQSQVIEITAYTWFNRLCALRYMDLNEYNSPKVISPSADGAIDAEIMQLAKEGSLPDYVKHSPNEIFKLIDHNPRAAYRTLLMSSCKNFGITMPFIFEKIEDWSELLLPDDLVSDQSIVALVKTYLTSENCDQVEVLGWLYQYYISEKKDEVFADLKKNKKITSENIPAATQLFTPHWIVQYLVQNTLGKIWLKLRPNSSLIEQMEYYIPAENDVQEPELTEVKKIQDIRFVDPCTGSGHILVYAFELLSLMYAEEGYDAHEIPSLILQNNLFGMEIDERASALAGFALCMKARELDRRFFTRKIEPQILTYSNVQFEEGELQNYFTKANLKMPITLECDILSLQNAKNFGSLLVPTFPNIKTIYDNLLSQTQLGDDVFLAHTHNRVLEALKQLVFLQSQFTCVVTNPPYMGGKGMNAELSEFAKKKFPDSKSDLFAMFIERGFDYAQTSGLVGMVTMQSWMFLSSYEALRAKILAERTIVSMAHLGARGFDSIGGEVVQTTAFVINKNYIKGYKGGFLRLVDGANEAEKQKMFKEALAV